MKLIKNHFRIADAVQVYLHIIVMYSTEPEMTKGAGFELYCAVLYNIIQSACSSTTETDIR